jgi:hypothetical protein
LVEIGALTGSKTRAHIRPERASSGDRERDGRHRLRRAIPGARRGRRYGDGHRRRQAAASAQKHSIRFVGETAGTDQQLAPIEPNATRSGTRIRVCRLYPNYERNQRLLGPHLGTVRARSRYARSHGSRDGDTTARVAGCGRRRGGDKRLAYPSEGLRPSENRSSRKVGE